MTDGELDPIVAKACDAETAADAGDPPDETLLERFVTQRDEAAFAALVGRHGPMVLGVCRRVLGNLHDADDAFQAAFLVLARRAASIRPRALLGRWLYGVAYRTALRARAVTARRRTQERLLAHLPEPAVEPQPLPEDWRPVLDQELQRLADAYREPLILCDLEGRTRREVARQLGLADGTLTRRLEKARQLLAKRLRHRGVVLTAGALAALLRPAAGAPSPGLARATARIAVSDSAAELAGVVAPSIISLARHVLRDMALLPRVKTAVALVACVVALGLVGIAWRWWLADQSMPVSPASVGSADRPGAMVDPAPAPQGQVPSVPVRPDVPGRIYLHARLQLDAPGGDGEQTQEERIARKAAGGANTRRILEGIIAVDPRTGRWEMLIEAGQWPRVARGGDTLLFVKEGAIWKQPLQGRRAARRLVNQGRYGIWAAGEELLINRERVDVRGGFGCATFRCRTSADGAELIPLAISITDQVFDVSPDGQWLAATSSPGGPEGPRRVVLVRPDGTESRRLTSQGDNGFPRFAPDGRHIVYQQSDGSHDSLWVVGLDGQPPWPILRRPNVRIGSGACWSPDGKWLAAVLTDPSSAGASRVRLVVLAPEGQSWHPVQLLQPAAHLLGGGQPDWHK
jgi:RNA polymerase sigma factor (sigma-70 family)